jgi:formate dehydrogenase alpha subunit
VARRSRPSGPKSITRRAGRGHRAGRDRWYARAQRGAIYYTLGITEHICGVDNVQSLCNLALLTGHIGREGTGINPMRGQNNIQGAGDCGALPNNYPGFQAVTDPEESGEVRECSGA